MLGLRPAIFLFSLLVGSPWLLHSPQHLWTSFFQFHPKAQIQLVLEENSPVFNGLSQSWGQIFFSRGGRPRILDAWEHLLNLFSFFLLTYHLNQGGAKGVCLNWLASKMRVFPPMFQRHESAEEKQTHTNTHMQFWLLYIKYTRCSLEPPFESWALCPEYGLLLLFL